MVSMTASREQKKCDAANSKAVMCRLDLHKQYNNVSCCILTLALGYKKPHFGCLFVMHSEGSN